MKNIKLYIGIIIGLVLSGITVYALSINSKDVSYKTTNVSDAIDDLYEKVANSASKFCELKSGNALEVGSMYECDPGDGVKRNFYILTVRDKDLDLIMDRNINNGSITWNNAIRYFISGEGATIKNSWINVMNIDLPTAQAIGDAAGRTNWIASDSSATWWCFGSETQDKSSSPYCTNSNQSVYAWLFNYTSGCLQAGCTTQEGATSSGYWTSTSIFNTNRAWNVNWIGGLDVNLASYTDANGVRPVITVLKGNLK